jgi:four helix bundle protein
VDQADGEEDRHVSSYQDLRVWRQAMDIAEACYGLTAPFPRDEAFGMTAQIRRSAASIAANIAEGYGRQSRGSFVQFLRIAQGSLKELETHLLLSERVGLLDADQLAPVLDSCGILGRRMRAFIRSLAHSV